MPPVEIDRDNQSDQSDCHGVAIRTNGGSPGTPTSKGCVACQGEIEPFPKTLPKTGLEDRRIRKSVASPIFSDRGNVGDCRRGNAFN